MPACLQGSYGIRHELACRLSVREDRSVMIKTSFWRSQIGDNQLRARHFFFPLSFFFPKGCIRSFIVCSRWKLVIFCAPIKTRSSIQTTAVVSSLYVSLPGPLSDVSESKKLARTTWPETHRPCGLGSSISTAEEIFVFELQHMIYYPVKFLAVINVLCLNGSNIPFNSWNHGYAVRVERLRVIGITPRAWIRMEGYKPLCLCLLQLDNDRWAFALRSIVLNVSPFNKIKQQFVLV